MGNYNVQGNIIALVVRIGDSKLKYTLESVDKDGKTSLASREFNYFDYFTESGIFLSYKFKKVAD